MSTAIASQAGWSQEHKDLIRKTVAQDASDAELLMFLHIANKAGLDPLQKQIHFTKRNGRVTVIAGIDGLQARAAREPDFEGLLSGVVCAKDDFEFDAPAGKVSKHTYNAFGDRGPIKGAWATVQRKGKLPFTAIVRFEEFNQPASPTWKQMPSVMIAKVAKSTALRMAYPEQFSAVYEGAEMDQAGVQVKDVTPAHAANLSGPEAVRAALSAPAPVVAKLAPPLIVDVKPGETEDDASVRAKTALSASGVKLEPIPAPANEFVGKDMDTLAEMVMAGEDWVAKNQKSKKLPEMQAKLAALQAEMDLRRMEIQS